MCALLQAVGGTARDILCYMYFATVQFHTDSLLTSPAEAIIPPPKHYAQDISSRTARALLFACLWGAGLVYDCYACMPSCRDWTCHYVNLIRHCFTFIRLAGIGSQKSHDGGKGIWFSKCYHRVQMTRNYANTVWQGRLHHLSKYFTKSKWRKTKMKTDIISTFGFLLQTDAQDAITSNVTDLCL